MYLHVSSLTSLRSKMYILPAFKVAVVAMLLTEAVQSFPEVEYCLQTPSLPGQNKSSSSSFTIEGNLPKGFGNSVVCQIQNDANASFLVLHAIKNSTGKVRKHQSY